jgi:hypothetical protein
MRVVTRSGDRNGVLGAPLDRVTVVQAITLSVVKPTT